MDPHFNAAKILFESGWCIRQFYSFSSSDESFCLTNGEDELSITNEVFAQFIDGTRRNYDLISESKTPFGIEKYFSYRA